MRKSYILFILVFGISTNLFAQVKNGKIRLEKTGTRYSLYGTWRFQTGDNPEYANINYDDSNWPLIKVPAYWKSQGFNHNGVAWYRARIYLSDAFQGRALGVAAPYIVRAHEFFVNGKRIGGSGRISPSGEVLRPSAQNRHYTIPAALLRINAYNTLCFRVSDPVGGGIIYIAEFYTGDDSFVKKEFNVYLLRNAALAAVMLFFGLYHFIIFLVRRTEKQYLFFALIATFFGCNHLGYHCLGYWLYDSFWLNLWLINVMSGPGVYVGLKFFHLHFEYRETWIAIPFKIFAAVWALFMLLWPVYPQLYELFRGGGMHISVGVAIAGIVYMLALNMIAIRDRRFGARIVGLGFFLFGVISTNGLLIDLEYYDFINLGDYGSMVFLIAIAVSQALKYNHIQQEREKVTRHLADTNIAFSRFVPKEFLQLLNQQDITGVRLGDAVQQEMTILFSDIRSFTNLSEKMTPAESFAFINSYLKRVGPVVRQHHGFIDKYIGDAIMALFPGAPDNALRAARDMQKSVADLNERRAKKGYEPIRIGIGIHTGLLMLGTIGEEERMDSTVISDAVNQASRMEGLTKLYGAAMLVTEATVQRVSKSEFHTRFLGKVQVKGKEEAVNVFELMDADKPGALDKKLTYAESFSNGIDLYQKAEFEKATMIFSEILNTNPADKPALFYKERSEHYKLYGAPPDWDGTLVMEEK